MPARTYARVSDLRALEEKVDRLLDVIAGSAPASVIAQGKPAQAKAESPFVTEFLRPRAASKIACEIHSAKLCNRRFTPKSSGRQSHVARLES